MSTRKTWLTAATLLAAAAIAAGCGDDDDQPSASGNATDAAFITSMTAHHQGAIDMAELAGKHAEHAEVRMLAGDIISAQKAEIAVMERIGDDLRGMGVHEGGHMGMSQSEMGMDMDMGALERAEPFDRAFIDAMVPHHQGAITMARKLLANGSQPALRKMAEDIIGAQSKEIAQMRKWRKAWYGSATAMGSGGHRSGDGSMEMGG